MYDEDFINLTEIDESKLYIIMWFWNYE
jgi:hypothetical protein